MATKIRVHMTDKGNATSLEVNVVRKVGKKWEVEDTHTIPDGGSVDLEVSAGQYIEVHEKK